MYNLTTKSLIRKIYCVRSIETQEVGNKRKHRFNGTRVNSWNIQID